MKSDVNRSVGVLIVSCDKYADLWYPFFQLFFKYWKDCPFPVYLGANFAVCDDNRVETIAIGEDKDWSSGFKKMLCAVREKNVIIMLEDYLLTREVDNNRLTKLVDLFNDTEAACLRLFPCPGPDLALSHPKATELGVGLISKYANYRVSLQAALWDKEVLLDLIKEGESPWEFELNGTERSRDIQKPFLSVVREGNYPIEYFCTAVVRGKWLRDAVWLCRREGITVNLQRRRCESLLEYIERKYLPCYIKYGIRKFCGVLNRLL